MSDAIYNQLQQAYASVNDALTGVYGRDGQRLFLLKAGGNTKRLIAISEVVEGYYVRYSKFREQMEFRVSTGNANFVNLVAQASYIGFGVPNIATEIEVYFISPDQRDRVQPNSEDVYWSLYATRKPEIRFNISE